MQSYSMINKKGVFSLMVESFLRGRQPFQVNDAISERRVRSEEREPNILRQMVQEDKNKRRSQSLPPHFRISEYKKQDRGVQTDENETLEQRARSVIEDLKNRFPRPTELPTQSRGAQTERTQSDYDTFERRAQLLRGHFPSDTDAEEVSTLGPSSEYSPSEYSEGERMSHTHFERRLPLLDWNLQAITRLQPKVTEQMEAPRVDRLDKQLQAFVEKAKDSPIHRVLLEKFQSSIITQKDARTYFYANLRNVDRADQPLLSWETNIQAVQYWLNRYAEVACDQKKIEYTVASGNVNRLANAKIETKMRERIQPIEDAIDTLSTTKSEASLLRVMDTWDTFSQTEFPTEGSRGQARQRSKKAKL
jgi:hypothetical protein